MRLSVWQLATATAFWLRNSCQKLLGNSQRQQAPLKGCACSCRLQLPNSATLAPHALAHSCCASARVLSSPIAYWGYIMQRRFYIHLSQNRFGRRGRGCANADGSRACVCVSGESSSVWHRERQRRSIRGVSGCSKGARRAFEGLDLVTIL